MSNEHPGLVPGRRPVRTEAALLAEDCPAWCDGQHEVDGHDPAFHSRVVAQRGDASVALSCIRYHDPAEIGGTVIILDMGEAAGATELEESDAIRMVGTLEAAADGTSWLAAALRSALELLDPGVGWTRVAR
jgi:hypothetical protein